MHAFVKFPFLVRQNILLDKPMRLCYTPSYITESMVERSPLLSSTQKPLKISIGNQTFEVPDAEISTEYTYDETDNVHRIVLNLSNLTDEERMALEPFFLFMDKTLIRSAFLDRIVFEKEGSIVYYRFAYIEKITTPDDIMLYEFESSEADVKEVAYDV